MPSYIIYEKPGLPVEEAIESAVFVKDHYSMLAFFLPLVWIVIRRLWWVLLGYLLLLVPLYLVDTHLPVWAGMLLTLLIGLWFALEAPSLISWSLKRKGYVELGSLYAENRDHCEARYVKARLDGDFANVLKAGLPAATARGSQSHMDAHKWGQSDPHKQKEDIIGLFPAPDLSEETK